MANRIDYGAIASITIDAVDGTHASPAVTFSGPFAPDGHTVPEATDVLIEVSDGNAKIGSECNYDIGILEYDPADVTTIKALSALPSTHLRSVEITYKSGVKHRVNGTRPFVRVPAGGARGQGAPIRFYGKRHVDGPTAEASVVTYPS